MSATTFYVCPECGSPDIQIQVWAEANGEKLCDAAGGYNWCPQCEELCGDGEVKYLDSVDTTLSRSKLTALSSVLAYTKEIQYEIAYEGAP